MRKRIACLLVLIMLLACAASFAEDGVAAGDKVNFGKYWQHMASGNTPAAPEPIVWRVLAVDGDKALLLAEQPLVGMPYNDDDHFLYEVTWETCSLRAWLNGDFLNDAFSSGEKQAIQPTVVSTPPYRGNDGYTVSGGNDTTDTVFLLRFLLLKSLDMRPKRNLALEKLSSLRLSILYNLPNQERK